MKNKTKSISEEWNKGWGNCKVCGKPNNFNFNWDFHEVCQHQFFETNKEAEEKINRSGVRVVCSLCGEVRILWQDGEINKYNKGDNLWVKTKLTPLSG